ncbi:MAG: hypothetical protein MJ252_05445 [archaeon]|nr:hypothetical protein [archaeon]
MDDQKEGDKKSKKITKENSTKNENEPPTKIVKYDLQPNESSLKDTSVYVKAIFNYIRTDQNLIYKLLTMRNNTKNDRRVLASFITNFLYENMFNYSLIDDEYLLILYRTLKAEIAGLEYSNKPQLFLPQNSINSYLFLSLNNKNFIKAYFKKIITPIMERMEKGENSKAILFLPEQINIIFEEEEKYRNKGKGQGQRESDAGIKRNNTSIFGARESVTGEGGGSGGGSGGGKNSMNLNISDIYDQGNYFQKGDEDHDSENLLDLEILRDVISQKLILETNQDMRDYLLQKFLSCKKKGNLYSNKKIKAKINSYQYKDQITNSYNLSLSFAVTIIRILIENLETYVDVVPYPVKCLCKIIDELIKIRFPRIYKYERIAFISQFFYEKLLKPIFEIPDLKCGFSEIFLSNVTAQNIKILQIILSKLFSGSFFNEKDNSSYTPFNKYFIEFMPRVMKLFDSMLKVELPPLIRKLLRKEDGSFKILPEEAEPYDYFKENPKEKIRHVSICYCLEDIETIMNLIKKNPDELFKPYQNGEKCKSFYKACTKFIPNFDSEEQSQYFEFLNECKKGYEVYQKKAQDENKADRMSMNSMRKTVRKETRENSVMMNNNPQNKTNNNTEDNWDGLIKRYFLSQRLELEPRFESLITPKDKPYFSLEGKHKKAFMLKEPEKYNIYEIKKNILEFLLKYQNIAPEEIRDCKTTLDILKKLIKLAEVDYYLMNETYALEWNYITIIQCIENLGVSHKYVKDDFEKIYNELLEELETSTNHLHLDPFLSVLDRYRYSKAEQYEIDDYYEKIKKTQRNKYIQQFAERYPIEVYLTFSDTGGKEKSLKIVDKSIDCMNELDSFLFDKKKHDGVRCKNILHFIKRFPDIFKNPKLKGEPFDYEKQLDYPEQIKNYLSLVKQHLEGDLKEKQIEILSQEELNLYFEEMSAYIMRRLYPKLYPALPNLTDISIMQKCDRLSWIEPKHFDKIEFIDNLDYYIEEIKKSLLNLDNEKSPNGKAAIFLNINNMCNKIAQHKLNIKEVTIDDTYDLILYCIIKSQPKRLNSNIQYVQLYLEKNIQKGNTGLCYTVIEGACNMIMNMVRLKNCSQEEFQK